MSRSVEFSDAYGHEVIVRYSYSVDVFAKTPSLCDSILSEISDILEEYNLHMTGYTPAWEDGKRLYRVNATFSGAVDRRGNTFK